MDTAGMVKVGVALRVMSENVRDVEHLTETPEHVTNTGSCRSAPALNPAHIPESFAAAWCNRKGIAHTTTHTLSQH